ncbi:MAG: hypothetical protein ACKVX9_17870 [Blastocatellia bacterium]
MSDLNRAHLREQLAGLENRRIDLVSKRKRANDQWRSTLNEADKVSLDNQIRQFDQEIEGIDKECGELDAKLTKLDAIEDPTNHLHRMLETDLHRIDYTEVKKVIQDLIARSDSEGAAALFLVQKSLAFQGDLCLQAIDEELRPHSFHAIHRHPVKFAHHELKDCRNLLDRIAGRFGVEGAEEIAGDPKEYADRIIRKICSAVFIGSVILIEIYSWDDFQEDDAVCGWFMKHFWEPLIAAFREHPERENAKLLVMLFANGPCTEVFLGNHCCPEIDFSSDRVQPLPLRNWRRDEIEAFLKRGVIRANRTTLQKHTERIFAASENGIPRLICDSLRELILEEV